MVLVAREHESLTMCVCACAHVSLQVLSPTYKQRNEDFRKLFKQLPDTERLIVGEWEPYKHKDPTGRCPVRTNVINNDG